MPKDIETRIKTYAAMNTAYIAFGEDHKETIQEIVENDGCCTCTARTKGPECPCVHAERLVKGDLEECICGLFVGR